MGTGLDQMLLRRLDEGGTAATANTWTNDKGDTQNVDPNVHPPGICKHAQTTSASPTGP